MLLGYNTNGFAHHRLEDALVILAELGYRSVALTLDYHALEPVRRPTCRGSSPTVTAPAGRVRPALRHRDRRPLPARPAPQAPADAAQPDPEERERRLDFLRRAVDVAAELGSDAVSFWSGTPCDRPPPEESSWTGWSTAAGSCAITPSAPECAWPSSRSRACSSTRWTRFAELHAARRSSRSSA